MKIYCVNGSANVRKVLAVADHLGLDYEPVELSFASGALRTDDYLAINPNAKVPALEDGGFHLWESTAIMQYLADIAPGGGALFPAEPKKRYDVVRWQSWDAAHWSPAIGAVVYERVVKALFGLGEPDDHKIANGLGQLERYAPILDAQLEGRDFVMGEGVTLADFSLASYQGLMEPAGVDLSAYPNITAWLARMNAIPAWAKHAPRLAVGAD